MQVERFLFFVEKKKICKSTANINTQANRHAELSLPEVQVSRLISRVTVLY